MAKPHLSLVGAGPGDPELVTLKALRTLEKADVILYDALVNSELLNYAPEHCEKIFVGKRAGQHKFPQEEINRLIVKYAFTHGHVVRLKGGDPFVFGRGHEELEYAQSFGIEVSIVPGISSAVSVPALQQIPLTKRGLSESFWVITGTTRTGQISQDVALAAQSTATVIILMGTRKLAEITEIFQQNQKGHTGVAIIRNGSLENEQRVIGTINTIQALAEKEKIGAPAVIIIGEVVQTHPEFQRQSAYIHRELIATYEEQTRFIA